MKSASDKLLQLPDKTFTFTLTIAKDAIDAEYNSVLKSVAAGFESKGFRKGKAPLDIVKANVSSDKLISKIFTHLVTHLYQAKITQYQLKPIIDPQVKITNPPLTLDKEWQIEITGCELPVLTFKSPYSAAAKKINSQTIDDAKKLDAHFDNLLQSADVIIPSILVESDVQKHLSDLVEQTQQAGITVTQYLKSRNDTIENYRKKLEIKVKNEWTINLAISLIALTEKLTPTEKEITELSDKNPQIKSNPNLGYYLLTQQKVVEFLKKL